MPLHLGAAWYPEHWPEARWAEDVKLMRDAGLTVVRVAEFAWSSLEPREGAFDFGWLERAIALAADHGLAVVIGTPTAAPPAWMTQAYPDVLAVNADGRPATHGARCHYDVTSERYLAFCRRIAEKLAICFGRDARVIGWQIDNEYNTVSYSEGARRAFQDWLRRCYGSLDALNAAWATAYWSQTYSDWSQIPLPIQGAHGFGQPHNPGLRLKWRQFITEAYRRFQLNQIEVIRAHAMPSQWITHNFMGFFDGFDHYVLSADLDFASWDQYYPAGHLDFARDSAGHDLTRGFKRKNFWLIETQPGSVNWAPINSAQDRGETRAAAWNAVAHGAEAVCYWQWRNAPNGQEQYHGSLIAPDGNPRPVYEEISRIGREFQQAGHLFDGATVEASVALLHSYDDRWALDFQRHHADFDPLQYLGSFYRPLSRRNIAMDILSTRAALDGYKLVIAAPHILDEAIAGELIRFVAGGGHLVLGVRSGMKDGNNALLRQRQPALLQDIAGAHVEEYYALREPVPIHAVTSGRRKRGATPALPDGSAHIWAEWLVPHPGAQVLMTYGAANGYLNGQAAVTMKPHASGGCVYYLGAWLDDALQDALMGWIVARAGVEPVLPGLPAGVHAMRRGEAYVLINDTEAKSVTLPWRAKDHLSGRTAKRFMLGPWDVIVATRV
ncbi:MAG: beta-galactosidase [Anaerolineae bacterium]|nr:beta-galactosidase [Candidatus Roseilinea sp.]MDW8449752.1 beta-galactosidase [Anaerolineae bacterium]